MRQYFRKKLEQLLAKEKSVDRLAASFCLGTFIALSPTIPLQTPLCVALSWVFRLNIGVAVAALYIVNNPITLIPIYVIGYAIGIWVGHTAGIDFVKYNPWWIDKFNQFISKYVNIAHYLGEELCFWCLMVGGFLFALMVSLPLYPLLKRVLARIALELEKNKPA
jgi:uncharacterized protein (DUF2062 family)